MQAMHAGFFFIVPFHRYITLGATLMLALSYCYCEQSESQDIQHITE